MKLFPSGIATDEAFCNREQEREQLRGYIHNTEHVALLAPRRYGKTSLTNQVVQEIDIEYAWIELFAVTSFESAQNTIASAVGQLIFDLAPDIKKLQMKIKHFFQKMKPEIVIGGLGQKVVLHPLDSTTETITSLLLELDRFAGSLGKQAVIVLDEFQQIAQVKNGHAIEACIRQAVERSEHISYIFSGSNRHMLSDMFSQSSRPLYRLCKLLILDRISYASYQSFIQQAAVNQWGEQLSDDALSHILTLTERHPYYVNVLCEQLWKQNNPPSWEDVEATWQGYLFSHKTIIIGDVINLTINQKKCLNALAQQPTQEPFSQAFQHSTNLSLSSLRQAIDTLYKKDIIFKDNEGYVRVLDPGVSSLMRFT